MDLREEETCYSQSGLVSYTPGCFSSSTSTSTGSCPCPPHVIRCRRARSTRAPLRTAHARYAPLSVCSSTRPVVAGLAVTSCLLDLYSCANVVAMCGEQTVLMLKMMETRLLEATRKEMGAKVELILTQMASMQVKGILS